jgi:hypothetical protein
MRKAVVRPYGSITPALLGENRLDCDEVQIEFLLRLQGKSKRNFRRESLVTIADHCGHAIQPGQLLRSTLRIAAGHNNSGLGVLPMRLPNICPRCPVSLGRYAAGVHYDRLAISARSPATEVLHMKSRHEFSLKSLRQVVNLT